MKKAARWITLAVLIAGAAVMALLSLVVVDETEFAVVTSFGRIAAVYGDQPSESGLHPKAPWQLAIKIDRRFRVFDPPAREVITGDKRNLEVAPYVVWRVADPIVFLRGSGSHELAEARLGERVSAGLSDAIGRRDLASLASTDAAQWSLAAMTREILAAIGPSARDELGIEVIDVRLRRFAHPLEVRPAVFDLIRSERRQVASKLRAEGEAQYLTITSQADRSRDAILAEAEAAAKRIRGNAEAEATRILNEAHARDPRFFEFLRTLEAYRSILDERSTLVLSASSPLLKLLVQGPAAAAATGPNANRPGGVEASARIPSIKNTARNP
jgi:membrane protease subunit HflC